MMSTNDFLMEFYRSANYREIAGPRSSKSLLAMIRRWVPWATDDSTMAWCAILRAEAAKATKTALPLKPYRALSWLTVGQHIPIEAAMPGDTVILDRGKGRGHVGLYVNHTPTRITVYGGNQKNRVGEDSYPLDDLLGIRRVA